MIQAESDMLKMLAKFMKTISDANRLKIIWVIGKEERSVSEIINETDLSQTLVSFHLKILRESDIVETKRIGAFIYYSLGNPELIDLISACGEYVYRTTGEIEPDFVWPFPLWFKKNLDKVK